MQVTQQAEWDQILAGEFQKPYWFELQKFLESERQTKTILPPPEEVFTAFQLTPFSQVRVLLLGQDPYPTFGHAHGLCFSVKPEVNLPASLKNIYKELHSDLGIPPAKTGYLIRWAQQGVLMLNTVLTVQEGQPNSHRGYGWETFTDAVIQALVAREKPCVFLLWGNDARKKKSLLDLSRHVVIESAHPSPLSARNGFFGSRPFSKINQALARLGLTEIDWRVESC
jgi:uracil-DNA glycosylase